MDDISIGSMIFISVIVVIVIVLIIQYLRPTNVNMYISESKRVTKPIDQKKYYADHEAIKLAHEMKGVTLLRTNMRQLS